MIEKSIFYHEEKSWVVPVQSTECGTCVVVKKITMTGLNLVIEVGAGEMFYLISRNPKTLETQT